LRRIMSNLIVDGWRRHNRFPMASLDEGRQCPAPTPEPEEPWQSLGPAEIRAAVKALPQHFRDVFELHHEQNLPYAEIARRLQLPLGTVGTRLLRARNHLRKLLTRAPGSDKARPTPATRRARVEMSLATRRISPAVCAND
jgi:RNA polymerase sigma-70 factor (ECF subfamily)